MTLFTTVSTNSAARFGHTLDDDYPDNDLCFVLTLEPLVTLETGRVQLLC